MKQQVVTVTSFFVTTAWMLSACSIMQVPSMAPANDGDVVVVESAESPFLPLDTLSDDIVVYRINPDESVVRFELDEEFLGEPLTVVGQTNQVAGEVGFDWAASDSAVVSPIQINARALQTDNGFRNQALASRILQTSEFEYIRFVPSAVTGLPDSIDLGETITFDMAGDLTIRDLTLPVTFLVAATAETDKRISGSASATINRDAFDLWIPAATGVANVEEEVELYIDFVALADE